MWNKLIVLIMLFILSACSSIQYQKIDNNDEIIIGVTSDPHVIDSSLIGSDRFVDNQKKSDGKLAVYSSELFDCLKEDVINSDLNILVINGDLTYNGEKKSHEYLSKELKEINNQGIQTLVIPGNHDVLNSMAIDYSENQAVYADHISDQDFKIIYKDSGYEDAMSVDESSLSYLFEAGEHLWLFMLDSNTWQENTGFASSNKGRIKQETMNWMKKLLNTKKDTTKVIVFSHHPNLDQFGGISYMLENYQEFNDFCFDNNIEVVVSGHIHVQNYQQEFKDNKVISNVSVSSLAVYDHQYTILDINEKTIDISTKNLDMESYAEKHHLKDDLYNNLFIDFNSKAYEYFKTYSTTRLVGQYYGEDIEDYLSKHILDLKGIYNCYEFMGEGYRIKEAFENDPLKSELEKYQSSYTSWIYRSIKYFDKDSTNFKIAFN